MRGPVRVTKKVTVYLPESLHTQAKIASAADSVSLSDFVADALIRRLRERRKRKARAK